jgi:hypothetical protein
VAPVQALVVVDMQRGVLADLPGAAALVSRVGSLIERASAAGTPVVQLQNDGGPGTPDEPGTPGWELVLPGGTVLPKSTDDGFVGTGLDSLLSGVRRVAICGVLSEMCVSAPPGPPWPAGSPWSFPELGTARTTWRTSRRRWWPGSPSTPSATSPS